MKACVESIASAPGVRVELGAGWVTLRTDDPHRALSFAPHRGGFTTTRSASIHEVTNADLPLGRDPLVLLAERMHATDVDGIGMLTSRKLGTVDTAMISYDGVAAVCVATVGLSNAVHVGDEPGPLRGWGTINILCWVNVPLTDVALVEAVSLVAEARTAAVLAANFQSRRSERMATGTGTDCIAVLASLGRESQLAYGYAGKHTVVGHVVGQATLDAVSAGLGRWKHEVLG